MMQTVKILSGKRLIFWDFDGVIKDSVKVKSDAFEQLFSSYGSEVADRVRQHHEANGGMSRFEKMPIYLALAAEPVTREKVQEFCDRFALAVQQAVINAQWVPGVREYLLASYTWQYFILVTATPQAEIEHILAALDLIPCFREIHGAPKLKAEAIKDVLLRWECSPDQALVVGDSESDFKAAQANHVDFLLRRTSLNLSLQNKHTGAMFEGLVYES